MNRLESLFYASDDSVTNWSMESLRECWGENDGNLLAKGADKWQEQQ